MSIDFRNFHIRLVGFRLRPFFHLIYIFLQGVKIMA